MGPSDTHGLLSRGSQVRVLPGAPVFADWFETSSKGAHPVPARHTPSETMNLCAADRVALQASPCQNETTMCAH